jgi:hypothetical protein
MLASEAYRAIVSCNERIVGTVSLSTRQHTTSTLPKALLELIVVKVCSVILSLALARNLIGGRYSCRGLKVTIVLRIVEEHLNAAVFVEAAAALCRRKCL